MYADVQRKMLNWSILCWGLLFPQPIIFFGVKGIPEIDMMILIVEDDVDLAETCSMVLETCNYDVQVAHSAEEALAKIEVCKPALLISDCVLPGRSGLELSQQLRSHHSSSDLPILLMSGSLRSTVAYGDSYDAFLNKPFLAEVLLKEVDRLLQSPQVQASKSVRGSA